MKPANSYQDPSMTPPDNPDLGDDECSIDGCVYLVLLDRDLCEEHTIEQAKEDEAERQIDRAQETHANYGQYETDGKGSY